MSIIMEINFRYGNAIKRIPFDSMEEANKVLNDISPKLGKEYYGRNEEEKTIHTIKSIIGDTVVVCKEIQQIGIVDYNCYREKTNEEKEIKETSNINYNIKYAKAMVEAGLGDYIK